MKTLTLSLPVALLATLSFAPIAAATDATTASPKPKPETTTRNISNWPDIPPRQAGSPYSAIIQDSFGDRQRNFESGRR